MRFVDQAIVLEEMGLHVFCSHTYSQMCSMSLLSIALGPQNKKFFLSPRLISEEKLATVTLCESNGSASLDELTTTTQNPMLNGTKELVTVGLNAAF